MRITVMMYLSAVGHCQWLNFSVYFTSSFSDILNYAGNNRLGSAFLCWLQYKT